MCVLYIHLVCVYIYKYLYIRACIYKYIAVSSSLGVNSISHEVNDSQELKYFDKSDPQPDTDD